MHHHHADPATLNLDRTVREIGPAADRWPLLIGLGGLVAAVLFAVVRGFVYENTVERFFYAYLHNFLYFLTISWGALFFVLVQHVTRAGWSVTIRRLAETMAAAVWLFAILFLPLLLCVWLGKGLVFPWTDSAFVAERPVVAHKIGYFTLPGSDTTLPIFFTLRAALYFAIWILLSRSFLRASLAQDATGDPAISQRLEGRSAWGILLAFLSVTFAAIDWAMSLDPEWFSTMYGVYFIAGSMVSFCAAMWVIVYFLQSRGLLHGAVTVEHQHDIGKLVFGFVVFWSYITFCQFLLIWYADIPEETHWYLVRQRNGWQWIGTALILGHFAIPFLGLMSRHVKRHRKALLFWCCWVLAMHWVDLYFIVVPNIDPLVSPFNPLDLLMSLCCFIGIGGLWVTAVVRTAADHPLVPIRDPRLHEALAFHNV